MNDLTRIEKLRIWMKRNGLTQEQIATKLDISRQTLISRMKDNSFSFDENNALKSLGFNE